MRPFLLVIEEDDEMQTLLVESLEDENYLTHGVTSAAEALKHCSRTRVDIAISSLCSIDRFGIKTYHAMQERYPELVFIITAPKDRISRLDLPGLKLGPILPTPFRLRDITKAVHQTSNWWLSLKRHVGEGVEQIRLSCTPKPTI
jgi:DNA-binding NtrC family response regulator